MPMSQPCLYQDPLPIWGRFWWRGFSACDLDLFSLARGFLVVLLTQE